MKIKCKRTQEWHDVYPSSHEGRLVYRKDDLMFEVDEVDFPSSAKVVATEVRAVGIPVRISVGGSLTPKKRDG